MTSQAWLLIGMSHVGGSGNYTAVTLEKEALFSKRVQAAGIFAALDSRAP